MFKNLRSTFCNSTIIMPLLSSTLMGLAFVFMQISAEAHADSASPPAHPSQPQKLAGVAAAVTVQQQAAFDAILARQHAAFDAIREDARTKHDAARKTAHDELAVLLSAEQLAKYDAAIAADRPPLGRMPRP